MWCTLCMLQWNSCSATAAELAQLTLLDRLVQNYARHYRIDITVIIVDLLCSPKALLFRFYFSFIL